MIPIDVVERWLEEKHCTLWADFDIDDAKGRRAAAEWFRHEIDSLNKFSACVAMIRPSWYLRPDTFGFPPPKEENRWNEYEDDGWSYRGLRSS